MIDKPSENTLFRWSGFASELRKLPIEERIPLLVGSLTERLSELLHLDVSRVDPDLPFKRIAPVLANVAMRWNELLRPWVKETLGFSDFHLFESSLTDSIRQLAEYLAYELEDIPIPSEPPSFKEDPNGWGWAQPEPYISNTRVLGNMLFILGTGRSGTSLFRSMLDCHDRIYAPEELHLANFSNMRQRRDDMRRLAQQWMDIGLIDVQRSLFGHSEWEAILMVNQFADQALPVEQVYQSIFDALKNKWLVDKTPNYARSTIWLQRTADMFSSPRYIFITRHPFAVMDSFIRKRFHRFTADIWGVPDTNAWHQAETFWYVPNRNILEFLSTLPCDQWLHISYESLMQDTTATLSRVCEFLSLPYLETMCDPYRDSSHITNYLQDRCKIDHQHALAWPEMKPPAPLSPLTHELAKRLGYLTA